MIYSASGPSFPKNPVATSPPVEIGLILKVLGVTCPSQIGEAEPRMIRNVDQNGRSRICLHRLSESKRNVSWRGTKRSKFSNQEQPRILARKTFYCD